MKSIWRQLLDLSGSTNHDLAQLCQGLPFCDNLSHHELHFFLRIIVPRTYQQDEIVFDVGKPAAAMYFVLSGSVGLYRQTKETLMERVKYAKRGECFGEEALLGTKLRSCTAQAQEETRVIAITTADFEKLVQTKPKIANKILHVVARGLYMQLRTTEDEMRVLTQRLTEANIIV